LNDTGVSLAQNGHTQEAEPLFRKAIAYSPLFVDARHKLVHDLAAMGRQEDAKEALKKRDPSNGIQARIPGFHEPRESMTVLCKAWVLFRGTIT